MEGTTGPSLVQPPFFKAAIPLDQIAQDLVQWRLQDGRVLKKEEEIQKTYSITESDEFSLFTVFLTSKGSVNTNVCACTIPPPYSYQLATSSV